jgi:hypothetical protein
VIQHCAKVGNTDRSRRSSSIIRCCAGNRMRWQSDLYCAVLLGIVDLVDLVVIALGILTESYSRSSTTRSTKSDCVLLVRLTILWIENPLWNLFVFNQPIQTNLAVELSHITATRISMANVYL